MTGNRAAARIHARYREATISRAKPQSRFDRTRCSSGDSQAAMIREFGHTSRCGDAACGNSQNVSENSRRMPATCQAHSWSRSAATACRTMRPRRDFARMAMPFSLKGSASLILDSLFASSRSQNDWPPSRSGATSAPAGHSAPLGKAPAELNQRVVGMSRGLPDASANPSPADGVRYVASVGILRADASYGPGRGLRMPSFSIRERNVLGFTPSVPAAPRSPDTAQ